MATQKKYVSLDKLTKYDELLKAKVAADDATTLQSAKDYADGLADNYEVAGAAETAKAAAIAAAKTETTTQVNTLANGAVKTNADAIAAIKDDANIDSFADVVAELAKKQAIGDYATKTEAKGYADAKDDAIAAAKAAGDAAKVVADANAEAITAINNETTGILVQAKGYTDTEVADVQANVDALVGKVGTVPEGFTVMGIIANIQENAYDDTELTEKIDGVDAKVTTLVGADTGKSVRTIANEELAAQLIAEGAAESLDTLQEIAAWIQEHPGDAAAMNEAITALQNKVDTGDKTVSAYVTDVIAALSIGDYAKAADLTALAGRVTTLETASATHATKTEVKAVSDALTEYKDAHASDYTNAQIDAAIKVVADDVAALGDTYATDTELATAIEGAKTDASNKDAVVLAEAQAASAAVQAALDTHTGNADIHVTADQKTSWTNAAGKAHEHSNFDVLEALTAAKVAAWDAKANAATTLAGYGITDAYTKTETDSAIATAIGQFVEVSEEEINALFA